MQNEAFIEIQPKDFKMLSTSLLSKPNLLRHAGTDMEECIRAPTSTAKTSTTQLLLYMILASELYLFQVR